MKRNHGRTGGKHWSWRLFDDLPGKRSVSGRRAQRVGKERDRRTQARKTFTVVHTHLLLCEDDDNLSRSSMGDRHKLTTIGIDQWHTQTAEQRFSSSHPYRRTIISPILGGERADSITRQSS